MIASSASGDRGQAFPIYIMVVGLLLFVAFALFAFAQAASARSGGQSAADASALAAAQESRDELTDNFFRDIANPAMWLIWLTGEGPVANGAGSATALANQNDSNLIGGPNMGLSSKGFATRSVEIETRFTVGDSVIPGTENKHAKAKATAVIEPRCIIGPESDPTKLVFVHCKDGMVWTIDPKKIVEFPGLLPEPKDLFSVHLVK
ncbi:pilus assembly protein TadG-related protein [Streptomyces sp. NPDC051561]|uniref:pilus assembly protein TadG-related protein n=1 Tax=Streptomyces sp. NPDC051561 TaxID=3365658 RepID=UPI0037B1B849